MTMINNQTQAIELSDEHLEDIAGGRNETVNQVANFVPYVGPINSISGLLGGPTIGDLF